MSRTWSWFLIAVWLMALFAEFVPWRIWTAVLVIPVSVVLVGLLHGADDDSLWRPPGFAALAGWVVFLVLQFIPLPPALLSFVAPGSHQLYSETIWVLRPGVWMPLAIVMEPALFGFLQFWVVAGIFWLTAQTGADHGGLGKLLRWFGLSAGAVALIAVCAVLLGYRAAPGILLPRGVVVTLAALVPLVLACHLYSKPHRTYGPWITRLKQALRHPLNYLHGYLLACAVLMSLVVVFCGAVQIRIALVCGLLLMCVALLWRHGSRSGSAAVVVLTLVLVVVVGLSTRQAEPVADLQATAPVPSILERKAMVKEFLLYGAGPGNLPALEKRYTRLAPASEERMEAVFGLPLLVETGLVGVVLSLWFWIAVLIAGAFGWIKRGNRMAVFLLPGVLSSLVVCFAAGADPGLPSFLWPGVTGYFLAGLLIAITCFSSSGDSESSIGTLVEAERWALLLFAGLSALGGFAYLFGQGVLASLPSAAAAVSAAATGDEVAMNPRNVLKTHLLFEPLEADNWFAAGNYWADQREDARALGLFGSAVRLDPLAGVPLYRVGALLEGRGYPALGMRLMLAGLKNAPLSPVLQRDYLLFMLSKGDETQALEIFPRLLLLVPEETGFWLRYLETRDIPREQWQPHLPRRAEIYRQYGDFLAAREDGAAADSAYMQSVRLAVNEPWVATELFRQIAAYFVEREAFEQALEVLRFGMQARPRDLTLLLTAGGLYQRLGITYRARELYRKALLMDPENPEVRARLDSL